VCPAEAIVLDPYPEYDARCFGCGNCVRHCPAGAIEHPRDWERLAGNFRRRAERMGELAVTRVFAG
jgi:Fe-S-cluster-containing hydrogenase component 2